MEFKHSDKYRKFGLNVAYYRKDRRFTQEGLAEAVGAVDDRKDRECVRGSVAGYAVQHCRCARHRAVQAAGLSRLMRRTVAEQQGNMAGENVSISVFT